MTTLHIDGMPAQAEPTPDHAHADQRLATQACLASVQSFLGGPHPDGDGWRFEFGEHLHSNWGAVHGGALAASAVAVARALVPERSPRALHLQIVRPVPSGDVRATASVVHAGRTVAAVAVDLYDLRGKLAVTALLTMVTPDAVAAECDMAHSSPPFHVAETALPGHPEVWDTAPIVDSLQLVSRRHGEPVALAATNVRPSIDGSLAGCIECTVPWDDLEFTGPEAACLLADAAIALPIINSSFLSSDLLGPNPDLTLRFTTATPTRVITGASSMLSVQHGTVTVAIEIQADGRQLAHALATSLLISRQHS